MEENNSIPDVEKIIAGIKAETGGDAGHADSASVAAADRDANLAELLEDANHLLAVQHRHSGIKGILNKIARRILEPELSDMRKFNTLSIKILNKLNAVISGNDTAEQSDFSAQLRRRIDLLTALGMRLDEYDRLDIEKRIQKLEERLNEPEKRGQE